MRATRILIFALLLLMVTVPSAFAANLVGISVSATDSSGSNEYLMGIGRTVTITVTGNIAYSGNVTVVLSRIRVGAETTPVTIGTVTLSSGTATNNATQINVDNSLQPGTYTINAIITSPTTDEETFDNTASTYIIVKKQQTQVPEVHPIFAVLIAFSMLFILQRNRK